MQKKDTKHSCALLQRLPSFFSASVFTLYSGTLKTFSTLLNTAFDIFFSLHQSLLYRYTVNVLSAESTDECLRTKSKDN